MLLYDRSMLVYAMMQSEEKGDVLRRQDGKCLGNNEYGLRNAALDETTNERQVNKMMKKLISLVMVLMLLAAVPANADSFFPAIPTNTPAPQSGSFFPAIPSTSPKIAPSYGALMGISPSQEYATDDGGLVRTYKQVTQEKFDQYGSYLQGKGYSYSQEDCTYDYEECTLTILLSNGSLSFYIGYDWDEKNLVELYPEGVTLETGITADTDTAAATEAPKLDIKPTRNTIAAGDFHTVAVKKNGTVVATGCKRYGECNVSSWKNVVAVSAGSHFTLGLTSDGTVLATGKDIYGQCRVNGYRNAVAISAGYSHSLVLLKDGTVLATGSNQQGQCNVGDWTDIVAISAGSGFTVGLKADGTVVAVGDNGSGECNVDNWKDIVAISAGTMHTVGLKADGSVIATGAKTYGQCDVYGWADIVAVDADFGHTVGLKANGTVVAIGSNSYEKCNVDTWQSIRQPE